jgi:hypothetical protein
MYGTNPFLKQRVDVGKGTDELILRKSTYFVWDYFSADYFLLCGIWVHDCQNKIFT